MISIKVLTQPAWRVVGDAFIISAPSGKPDANSRKLIRSYVMRGKNSRKPVAKLNAGSWINGRIAQSGASELTKKIPGAVLPRIRPLCPELKAHQFPDHMQPHMLDLVFKCKQHSFASSNHVDLQGVLYAKFPTRSELR